MKVVYRGSGQAYSESFRREIFEATLLIGWFVVESTAVTRRQGRFVKSFSRFHIYPPPKIYLEERRPPTLDYCLAQSKRYSGL